MLRVCIDKRIFSFLVPFFLFCSQQKRKNERKKNMSDTIFRFALCMPGSTDFNELQRLLQQSAFVQMLKQVQHDRSFFAEKYDYSYMFHPFFNVKNGWSPRNLPTCCAAHTESKLHSSLITRSPYFRKNHKQIKLKTLKITTGCSNR